MPPGRSLSDTDTDTLSTARLQRKQTLVVPLDGSPLAERAVPYAIRLAQAGDGRLVLLQVLGSEPHSRRQRSATMDARVYLDYVAESMAGQVTAVEIATPHGEPTEKILETVDKYQADGVVMATHGRTGFAHVLYGSVTEGVLAQSSVPV
ncbi:MAG: universal stress protein, partial [Chloroflexi bacterium]|nr:universal stress protein [Chloroflexota bacterium]